jgi:hypothetical protein
VGRPYSRDLAALPQTYTWALSVETPALVRAIGAASGYPLIYVGSGGSLSAASFGAQLHARMAMKVSRAATPLEAAALQVWRDTGAIVLSAGGNNPDTLGILRFLIRAEPAVLAAIISRAGSRAAHLIRRFDYVELTEAEPPIHKDSFLATNTLLSTCIFLHRAYCTAFGVRNSLPATYGELVPAGVLDRARISPALSSPNILVLYSPTSKSGAIDLESKVNEAGLGNIQLADFRNFAHGRHTGLAISAEQYAVIALVTTEDRTIARKTLNLVPKHIPSLIVRVPFSGPEATIGAVAVAMELIGIRAQKLRREVGRPHVPQFGRKLYHMNTWPGTAVPSERPAPIVRKIGASVLSANWSAWDERYRRFVRTLSQTPLDGVVVDYDGTICDPCHRFSSPPDQVVSELGRLLRQGAIVGIATGRGKSVKTALQNCLTEPLWPKLTVGYYNCSQIATLDNSDFPDGSETICPELQPALERLTQHPIIHDMAKIECRGKQITVRPLFDARAETVRALAVDLLSQEFRKGVSVVYSTHSIDVLAVDTTKLALVEYLEKIHGRPLSLLRVGDLGQWPGNDFDLLSSPLGLSCYRVSADAATCWNLAPFGIRFSQATVGYLKACRRAPGRKRQFQFQLRDLA